MGPDFGERLKNYRRAKDLTQRELAETIGVSDKTVSRWESGGGYPDVPVLVPLAKALGVTVDDLLNEERPVRTLTKADGQNLLSFAFALGGGVLFFLLDLFMPALLCYLGYLGCLAYGVYLQKYYAYQSHWFLLGEVVVNLGVNLTVSLQVVVSLAAVSAGAFLSAGESALLRLLQIPDLDVLLFVGLGILLLALVLTAVTQYLVWKKGFGGRESEGRGLLRLGLGWPSPRRLLPALIPLLAGLYWLPAFWKELAPRMPSLFSHQEGVFALLLGALALLCTLPLLKKGLRRWIAPTWLLAALCFGMTGLRTWEQMWGADRFWNYRAQAVGTARFIAVGWGTEGTLAVALVLAAAWVLLSCLRLTRKGEAIRPYAS